MSTDTRDTLVAERVSVGLSFTLNTDVRRAAAARGMSVPDYVRSALYAALTHDGQPFTPMPATPAPMRTFSPPPRNSYAEYENIRTGEKRYSPLPERFR